MNLEEIEVDTSLPKEKRVTQFIEKIGNPYAFNVGNVEVNLCFQSDGVSLQEKIEHILLADIS